jgi:tetratricopeptide (TPR) repeat protein
MRYLFICLLFSSATVFGQSQFIQLDKIIEQSGQFDARKEADIKNLRSVITYKAGHELYTAYDKLYEEYKVFNYDSAYRYTQGMLSLARQFKDDALLSCAQLKSCFILISAGLFKEAFDSLKTVNTGFLGGQCKTDYYKLMARLYYDLADYTNDENHSPWYNALGNAFIDSALNNHPEYFDVLYYSGLKKIREGKIAEAATYLKKLIHDTTLTLHQQALATSTMSDIYIQKGKTDSAITLLVSAAVADIKSSTKETSAIFNLSNILFKKGDLKNASTYIEKAVKDAVSYGARQRKVQMSTILPLIEGEKIARVEHEKRTVMTYAIIVTLLVLLLGYLIYFITRQIRKLKIAQKALTEASQKQQEMNRRLMEANKIKEEYIGFIFNANTAFFDKMERFREKAEAKIRDHKSDELLFHIKNLRIQQEREDFLKNFDSIFLKIFPGFIDTYNSLFNEEDQVHLKDGEILNTDLRIFALIRMGIQDNDKIANILRYSVNTINTYKTRIKNKSIVPNELFEDMIMEIESV